MTIGTATTGLAGLVGKSVSMAGDLQQQLGGSEAVFENFAETVKQKGAEAYKVMGLSQNDYLATANKMGSLMQGAGLPVEKSMDLSTQAMQRASDVASVMGIDVNSAMESIAGAAKGNFTMMDNLGVAMNATTIEAYALSKGIKTSYDEMENSQKVELAMQMFLEKTSKYAGNYAKENETFAGSFTTLKASIQNFMSGAGGIEEVADALVNFSEILVNSIGTMAPKIVEGIIKLIETLMPQIPVLLNTLLPSVLQGAIGLINGLVAIFPELIKLIQNNLPTIVQGGILIIRTLITAIIDMLPDILKMGITLLLELIKGITDTLPELIPTMIKVIMDMVNILLDNIDVIIEAGIQLLVALIEGIMNALPELVSRLPEIIIKITSTLINLSPQLLSAALRIIMALAEGLVKYIPEMISRIPQIIKSIVEALKQGLSDFVNIGVNLIKGLWQGISDTKTWLINKVKSIGKSITSAIKSVFGIHSPSKEFAWIGKMNMIGLEEGMEDMKPEIDGTIDKILNLNYDTSGLDFLKNGASYLSDSFSSLASNATAINNVIRLENSNSTKLMLDRKVLAEVVNNYNSERKVAV